jgi:hypothetical protein
MTMTTLELIADRAKDLPAEKQREVLDFVEFVRDRCARRKPLRSSAGLCADLGIALTEQDIAEARREMWGKFPREDF